MLFLKWCRNSELNQGHRDFQSLALPTELLRHLLFNFVRVGRASSTLLTLFAPFHSTQGELLRQIANLFSYEFLFGVHSLFYLLKHYCQEILLRCLTYKIKCNITAFHLRFFLQYNGHVRIFKHICYKFLRKVKCQV